MDVQQSPTTLEDRISQIAAEIALDNEIGERSDEIAESLKGVAALAHTQGRSDIANAAAQICTSMNNSRLSPQQLFATLTEGIENLALAVSCSVEEQAPSGLSAISQDPELIADFIHEAREHLESIELHLLAVEENRNAEDAVHAIFRSFHTIKGLAGFLELPRIQDVAHETETVLDNVRQGLGRITPATVDVILESRDYIAAWLRFLETNTSSTAPAELEGNAALLARISALIQGSEDKIDTEAVLADPDRDSENSASKTTETPVAETPVAETPVVEAPVAEAPPQVPASSEHKPPEPAPSRAATESASATPSQHRARSVKVDTEKLDYLVDMVGEVVIAQSLIRHSPELAALHDTPVGRNLAQLARITEEVQRTAMAMRMVPIGPLFQKMARLVRDLARKSGKQIVFESSGEDVELDRNIVEELADPLMHMIRNAADHGIEMPEVRVAAGKNPKGRIGLRAFHGSGQIMIEISDDGGGLRRDRILAKAREKGLISPGATVADSECLNLIFQPGFSTAEKVSDLSGRGVGMDVVRKQIQRLRGSVDIESVEGGGTTFSLRLPLTLAIIDGLIVGVGQERYVIPLASVKEMLRPGAGMVSTIEGRAELVTIRDRMIPLVRLHSRFGIEPRSTEPTEAVLVVAEVDGVAYCLMVDELIGKQEVVIKGLGSMFQHVAGVAGGAILGDGHIGLILDLKGIFGGRLGA